MVIIICYHIGVLMLLVGAILLNDLLHMPSWYLRNVVVFQCAYVAGVGGVLYCLRAVYLNRCVRKCWDNSWRIWYFLRPLTSMIGGFGVFLFLPR